MSEEEQRKKLATLIADVIQRLLRDSDELTELLEQAHEEGYDIFLSILSGIVVRRREEEEEEKEEKRSSDSELLPLKFEFTEADKTFLQSIGIQVSE